MASSMTHEEARDNYKRLMGGNLGTTYHLLWNECALLHMRWAEYVELFASKPDNFDIMNDTAPGFFHSVQELYWESVLLGLCRFADKKVVSGRKTLSMEALLSFSESNAVTGLQNLISSAQLKMKFAQDWRNRRIAHADLHHAMDKPATELAPASRTHVREALAALVNVLNAVEGHFTGSSLGFMGTGARFGGTYLLLQLRVASRLQKEHRIRITTGNARDDDYDWHKWRGTL